MTSSWSFSLSCLYISINSAIVNCSFAKNYRLGVVLVRNGDIRWGEYNRKSSECMLSGQWEEYRNIRFQMFLQLLDEKRYTDSFLMLSEVFLYCLNGSKTPCIQSKYILYAQRNFVLLNVRKKDLSEAVVERLSAQYSPYKTYSVDQVASIFLLNASGNRDRANKIFCRYCPDVRAWLEKLRKLNNDDLAAQDRQLQKVQTAEAKYKETGNLEWYVAFWESLWEDGGLLFGSMKWWFVLPDLYFKQKRFDDVITFCEAIKVRDEYAIEKADKYIQRAQERKAKQAAKR